MRIFEKSLTHRLTAVGMTIASLGLVAACASAESAADSGTQVASVAKSGAAQAPVSGERPLMRPDMSEEDQWRLTNKHMACVESHGIKMLMNADGSYKGVNEDSTSPKVVEAYKKCQNLEPETLANRAKRTDPLFLEKADKWVKCIRSHGIELAPSEPGQIAFPDGLPSEDKLPWVGKCEIEVFAGK